MENHNKIKENIIPVDDKIQLNSSISQTIINRRKAKSTGGCSSADEKSNEIAPVGLSKVILKNSPKIKLDNLAKINCATLRKFGGTITP
jgi:hypothetical protein